MKDYDYDHDDHKKVVKVCSMHCLRLCTAPACIRMHCICVCTAPACISMMTTRRSSRCVLGQGVASKENDRVVGALGCDTLGPSPYRHALHVSICAASAWSLGPAVVHLWVAEVVPSEQSQAQWCGAHVLPQGQPTSTCCCCCC
jgi:hypothetical protein